MNAMWRKGGGSVAGLVVRALCAAACFSLVCLARASSVVDETVKEEHALSGNAKVTIRNADGRIHVYGSNKDELTIIAWKRAFTKERLDGIKVNAVVTSDSAVIDTIYPPAPEGLLADRSGTVDYTIYVPQACTLEKAELVNGEIMLQDLRGPSAHASTDKGRILVRNCFTALRLAVGAGGMDVFYTWWETGAFSLLAEIASGNMRLALPPNAAAQIEAEASSGSIRYSLGGEQQQGDQRTLTTTIGDSSEVDLKIRAARGNIRIEKSY